MTPERLAECPHTNLWWAGCVSCGASFQDIIAAQRAHIRDLEAQVREARDIINEIRSEAQRTINWNQTRGMRPATDTSMFASSYGAALRVSRLIDAVLATATPPSPEVGE